MTVSRLQWVLLATLLVPGAASAQRISLLDFTGPTGRQVRSQLVNRICDTADCVAANKVVTAGKPDGKKAKRELLQYVVQGAVTRGRGRAPGSLEVTVLTVDRGALAVKARRAFALDPKGLLAARSLPGVVEFVKASLQEPAPPPEPVRPPPQPTARPAEPAPGPTPVAPPPERAPEPAPEPVVEAAPRRESARPIFLAVELGTDLLNRNLDYVGATTGNVRTYQLPFFALPQVRLEVYPLALAGPGLLSGLGVEGAFAYAPWLKSKRLGSDTDAYPTTVMRIDAAVRWRIAPFASYALAFTPYVGWRLQSFTVGPLTAGGARLDGLPDITFNGLRAGLQVEVPVLPERLIILAHGGVLPMFSAGELISSTFFKGGSTFGFEVGGGLALQLWRWLQIRATFEYTRYNVTFQTTAGDTYVATSASDTYLGGNASLRLQF